MKTRGDDVSRLTSMGFQGEEARNALQKTNGNVEMAIDRLLSGEGVGSDNSVEDGFISSVVVVSPFLDATNLVVRGSTSQYSYGSDGRSACTCIALAAAETVANPGATNESKIMTTQLLDRSIEEGVARYIKLRNALTVSSGTFSSGSNDVEHLSADEVLLKDDEQATRGNVGNNDNNKNVGDKRLFDVRLSIVGGGQRVRQGALSRDRDHPLGMKLVLEGLVNDIRIERRETIRQNACDDNMDSDTKIPNVGIPPMICILLTKSPETVLLCLPYSDYEHDTTNNSNNGVVENQQYWLIDSHPRPHLLSGVETSYAKPHNSFDSLLQSLRDMFPFTDLGPDIPSMMSDMYNMFDLYTLEGRKHRT